MARWGRRLALAYAALLLASHGVRLAQGRFAEPVAGPGVERMEAPELAMRGGEAAPTGEELQIAFRRWPEPDHSLWRPGETAPTLLLVHGSPGDGSNFSRLAPLLAERGIRSVAVDLPGFGASTQQVADYSLRVHADYARLLLDHLDLERVHALGFSLGGGVVLHLHEIAPERVRSLTMLAAVGVQDLELLGSYSINHAIHGVQLLLFQAIQELVPHFGLLDASHVHLSYARNFFDSDQRPLRALLESYPDPMLILHGTGDVLVPYAAAQEHHRIVPQSELVSFDANHFMPFRSPRALAEPIAGFLGRVEAGAAAGRGEATAERLEQAAGGEPFRLPRATGPTLVVWFLLLMVATLVSEDLTCIAAGLLVAQGSLGFTAATLACGAGIFVGDMGLYALGRLGRPFLSHPPLRWWIKAKDLERSRRWFEEKGPRVVLVSRFVPGTRLPTYVGAGLLAMNPLVFALYLIVPVALWTPLLVFAAKLAGDRFLHFFQAFEAYALPVFLGVLATLWIGLGLGRSLSSWQGRRRLVGRIQRIRHWEFWPPWAFYPPLVLYLAVLAVKERSLTLFTAVNPGIPGGGGFVGESKSTILGRLGAEHVAPWWRLEPGPAGARQRRVFEFARENGGLPVVLKPDVGERGSGVVIARRESQVDSFLEANPEPAIVQRFVPGVELGIFWLRRPGSARGEIYSITDKRLPALEGDGRSTLERLVLQDRRAVALADLYLARFENRLEEVPEKGARVPLAELGTHCRGAIFLDGSEYRTPQLEERVERIATSYRDGGFDFGRFDVRAPSYDHFRRGEELQVLELNGVTSEATHIYDPRHSVLDAWRILARQWRLAFEIGRHNRDAGHPPLTARQLIRLVRENRRRPRES
ncbi:MAG: alpha/beta fold hydrolase [Acidobacteriota bacterium]